MFIIPSEKNLQKIRVLIRDINERRIHENIFVNVPELANGLFFICNDVSHILLIRYQKRGPDFFSYFFMCVHLDLDSSLTQSRPVCLKSAASVCTLSSSLTHEVTGRPQHTIMDVGPATANLDFSVLEFMNIDALVLSLLHQEGSGTERIPSAPPRPV